jgi:hypothetical protein
MSDWLLFDAIGLVIALLGIVSIHIERRADAIARRAKQVSSLRDYA